MAVNSSQGSSGSIRSEFGEIDTKAPFESVKEAITLYGRRIAKEKYDHRRPLVRVPKRHAGKETQLQQLQRELKRLEDELNEEESAKSQALAELAETERALEDLTSQLQIAKESEERSNRIIEFTKLQAEEVESAGLTRLVNSTAWAEEFKSEREKYLPVIMELHAAKQQLKNLQREVSLLMKEKISALGRAEVAETAAEANTELMEVLKRQEKLQAECNKPEREYDRTEAFQSERGLLSSQLSNQKQTINDLETKLIAKQLFVNSLRNEIDVAKDSKENIAKEVSIAKDELVKLLSEIEKFKQETSSATLEPILMDLETAKSDLYSETQKESALRILMESLRAEVGGVKGKVAELKHSEAEAKTKESLLIKQVDQAKCQLIAVTASEVTAKKDVDRLSLCLQEINEEMEEETKHAREMKERAKEAQLEAHQAKVNLKEAEARLQTVLTEAETAKAAEKVANHRLETIFYQLMGFKDGAEITISKEEYDSLNSRVIEANELTNMKAIALTAEIEAINACERELRMKLNAANTEKEEITEELEKARNEALKAESAKQLLEGELRRMKARDIQKKAVVLAALEGHANNCRNVQDEENVTRYHPFGEALNIKMNVFSPDKISRSQTVRGSPGSKKKGVMQGLAKMFSKRSNSVGHRMM